MLIFKLYNGQIKDWDLFLKQKKFYDVRHSFTYYQYLRELNNNNIFPFLIFKDEIKNENLVGQFILKKINFFIFNVFYIYCGPTNIESYFKDFKPEIIFKNLKITKGISYLRLKTFLPENLINLDEIKKNNWKRQINFEENLVLDLTTTIYNLKKNLSRNWRHNFYRSKKNILKTKIINTGESDRIYQLYLEMCKIKKIKMPFSKVSFKKFFDFFNRDILTIGAYFNGELVSIRSVLLFNNKALDIFAATNSSGRNLFASYRLLWEIILLCKKKRIKYFDLNGLDKKNNLGVYNFKIGIGGSKYKPLGILEYCNFKILLPLISFVIKIFKKFN